MISVVLPIVITAVVSLGHMRELAPRHGEAQWSATLTPLSVDGRLWRHPRLSADQQDRRARRSANVRTAIRYRR
nr:DUF2637 domain-containing protein [Actinoallomurus bryophytorum]